MNKEANFTQNIRILRSFPQNEHKTRSFTLFSEWSRFRKFLFEKAENNVILTFDDSAAQKETSFEKVEKGVIITYEESAAQKEILFEKNEKGVILALGSGSG